jgi:hypothetical protein
MKIQLFYDTTPCILVNICLVTIYQLTLFRITERLNFHQHCCGNLSSLILLKMYFASLNEVISFFSGFLTFEDGTDRLPRKVGTELLLNAA